MVFDTSRNALVLFGGQNDEGRLDTNYTYEILYQDDPTVINQPTVVTSLQGQQAQLPVVVAGAPPIAYQWQKGGVDLTDDGRIAGSGTNTLYINGATAGDSGFYRLSMSNLCGMAVSQTILLNITAGAHTIAIGAIGASANGTNSNSTVITWGDSSAPCCRARTMPTARGLPSLTPPVRTRSVRLCPSSTFGWFTNKGNPPTDVKTAVMLRRHCCVEHMHDRRGDVPVGLATLLSARFSSCRCGHHALRLSKRIQRVAQQPVSQTVAVGGVVSLQVVAAGVGPFSYQWKRNGVDLFHTVIVNVAGDGSLDYTGDGAAATNTGLTAPYGLSLDSSGNLFIADAGNSRIRKVAVNGTITTAAGNGSDGYSGDGGAATKASLFSPTGVAVDGFGNIFISDTYNNRIRKVTTNGMITTVAGVGLSGDGDGGYSGDNGMATNASLQGPMGLALDLSGNLFIADTGNSRIRKVAVNGIITTAAGSGSLGYSGDGGLATSARLRFPYSVAVDASGNLYFADLGNSRIRKINTNGIITTVAGNGASGYSGDGGVATNASLNSPYGVAVDASGNLFIADSSNNRIREVDFNGIITTAAGNGASAYSGDGGAATQASVNSPFGVAVDANRNLFVADTLNSRVREVYSASKPMLSLGAVSTADGGDYEVIVTSPYGSVTSAVASVTVGFPPSIIGQSTNVAAAPGGTAAFNVEAQGTPPFFYSWYFNDTNLVQTGTNSTLVLANATYAEAGHYSVVITNLFGIATSGVATLKVFLPQPSPASQPAKPLASAAM